MNPPKRIFLGWDTPAIELVAEKLLEGLRHPQTSAQYRRATVVVPTTESGRRLREYMAEWMKEKEGKPILMPKITLAGHLIPLKGAHIATEEETLTAWLQVLGAEGADPVAQYAPLIPRRPETHRERWAVGVAHKFIALRSRLEQEEVSIDRVTGLLLNREEALQSTLNQPLYQSGELQQTLMARKAVLKNEQLRWHKLGELFSKVDSTIRSNNGNPNHLAREEAIAKEVNNPTKPHQSDLLIIACQPELSPQLEHYLLNLHSNHICDVQVWINCPETEADHFDAWGRPKEESWMERDIDIPQATPQEPTIHLVNDAQELAEKARYLAGGFNSAETVLITGDSAYTPALIDAFADDANGWGLKSPEGRSFLSTNIGQLPAQLADFCTARQDFFSNATQNGGMLELNTYVTLLCNSALQRVLGASPKVQSGIQRHIEKLREILLPASIERLCHYLHPDTPLPEKDYREFHYLAQERSLEYYDFAVTVAAFAEACCHTKTLPDQLCLLAEQLIATYKEEPLRGVALSLGHTIRNLLSGSMVSRIKEPVYLLELLRYKTQEATITLQPTEDDDSIWAGDVRGWRELTFATGRRVIIAAMHDGCIPEPIREDEFLPKSLCKELGIKHEAFRSARDAYLLTALLHSRPSGEVHFILARQNPDGTPVAPSTLLLRCGAALPERARTIFAETASVSAQPVLPLCPLRPALPGPERDGVIHPGMMEHIKQLSPPIPNPFTNQSRTFSPSSLSGFLQCPLSFWLSHLFGLDAGYCYDEEKSELESNEYGTLMHAILRRVVEDVPSLSKLKAQFPHAADENDLAAALTEYAKQTAATEWSQVYMLGIARNTQPLPMEIQLRNIEKTLQDFAWRHVQDLQAGWRNICCEHPLRPTFTLSNGEMVRFSMVADRIDYNEAFRRWRIIDYKTSSGDKKPFQIHFDEVKDGKDSPFFRFMNTEEYPFPLVSAAFGSKGECTKYYRWKDVQLMLYTFGLRGLNAKGLNPELPDEALEHVMPDLYYYNLQHKTQKIECYPLLEHGKLVSIPGRGKQLGFFCQSPEALLQNAMQTVDSAIRMIRDGKCLFSAEALRHKNRPFSKLCSNALDKNAPRFGAISQQCDPRSLFNLPQLHI